MSFLRDNFNSNKEVDMSVFDGRQIAAARALANVGAKELAEAASVTPRTIGRLETDDAIAVAPKRRHGHVTKSTFDKTINALAERGVELLPEREGHGAGVRWMQRRRYLSPVLRLTPTRDSFRAPTQFLQPQDRRSHLRLDHPSLRGLLHREEARPMGVPIHPSVIEIPSSFGAAEGVTL